MTLQLRPYQQQIIEDAREALRKNKAVLIQAPTGAGKTALTVSMMASAAAKGMRSFFVVHQNELLSQTSKALWSQKLEHGMVASGKARSGMAAQVASVQTLVNRLNQYKAPELIIIDEAHRAAASTYRKVLEAYPDAYVIGLTATPARTDGRGLSDLFDCIVEGPTITQLIEAGYLCDYEILAPPQVADISAVKTMAGDYDKKQTAEAMDKPTITGDAVQHYKAHAMGKRCVVMCVTLEHAKHVCDSYNASGVIAEFLHGGLTDNERESMLLRFARGDTIVLTNVQLLIEGVDIPMIEVVQWLRPTKSLIVYMQGNGRGLRPAPGKPGLLILDHVGNYARHGLPDDDREWSLEGRKKGSRKGSDEQDVSIQQCKKCWHVFRPGLDACPSCGEPIPVLARKIETVDGKLVEVQKAIERKRERIEQGKAKSIEELIQIGMRKGMKNPHGWAANVLAGREGRKAGPEDYKAAKAVYSQLQRPSSYAGGAF